MSRQGSSAAGRAARCQADLNSLPDPLLALIMEHLPLATRIGRCSLVNRRWHAVCHSSQLLHTVQSFPCYPKERLLPKLRSLQLWMLRHAGHVECLELRLYRLDDVPAEALTLVAGILATCSAAGRLRQLTLYAAGWPLVVSSWAARRSHLEVLNITARRIEVTASLAGLKSLRQLELDGREVVMLPSVRLPPSLTHVELSTPHPPPQVMAIPALKSLKLSSSHEFAAANLSGLTNLPASLLCLTVVDCTGLPPGLSGLTRLQDLDVSLGLPAPHAAADVGPAIANLTQLTNLWLETSGLEPPPQLANLTSLQRLFFCRGGAQAHLAEMDEDEMAEDVHAFPDGVRPGLPAGAWLSGLTRLSLSLPQLLASLDALQGATQLQRLDVLRVCCTDGPFLYAHHTEWERLWAWVAALQPLEMLSLLMSSKIDCRVLDALLNLTQCRPALRIFRPVDLLDYDGFW